MLNIKLKQVYEPPLPSDGVRILVERLWPRGMSKDKAQLDHWVKELAPSTELRKWYAHDVEKWPAFKAKYIQELKDNPDAVRNLYQICKGKTVTFVFAARDKQHNSAVLLKEFMKHCTP